MSLPFLKNLCGLHCTTSELLQVPRPKLELGISITFKSIEAGIIVGSIAIPLLQLLSGTTDPERLKSGGYKGGVAGSYMGVLVGPLVAVARMHTMDDAQIYQQVCRLRTNSTELVIDRAAIIGGALGYLFSGSSGLINGVNLAVIGSALSYLLFPDRAKE